MRSSRSGSAIGNRRSPTGREESSRRTSRRSRPTRKLPSLWSREASAEREVPRESASAERLGPLGPPPRCGDEDRKSTRLNSSHLVISYAVFCLKKKKKSKK